MMTFLQAHNRLVTIANGEYCTMTYDLKRRNQEYSGVSYITECTVYIHKQDRCSGTSWEEALAKMEQELGLNKAPPHPEQIPCVDVQDPDTILDFAKVVNGIAKENHKEFNDYLEQAAKEEE